MAHCWRAGAIQLRSGHDSYKHVLRSKQVIVGIYTCTWSMKYIRSMKYKACSRDMHIE